MCIRLREKRLHLDVLLGLTRSISPRTHILYKYNRWAIWKRRRRWWRRRRMNKKKRHALNYFKMDSLYTVLDGIRLKHNQLINIHSSVALLSIMYGNLHIYRKREKKHEDENLSCKTEYHERSSVNFLRFILKRKKVK